MIRIAIVEDDINYQKQLMEFLQRFEQDRNVNIEVETFSDGDEFINNYKVQFDIILMDVQMPLMDGMSAAEEIRKVDSKVVIIFITNMTQYAIKGYAVDALDYVLKPITYFSFSERLKKAIDRLENRKAKYITVKVKSGFTRLELTDVFFVESQGHKLIFNTSEGELESSGAMKDLEKELEGYHFFRIHKGYLVNLNHVDGISDHNALVKDQELPISRAKRKLFMKALANLWGEVVK